MQMGIFIKANISMGSLKALVNTIGLMDLHIGEILNRDIEMGMEYGNQRIKNNNTKDIIFSIENMDTGFMIGGIILSTRVST